MSGTTATGWLMHTLAGGGLLLLLALVWAAWTRQPVRRLRVAEWAVTAALLLAVLSLGPAWLVVTAPAPSALAATASLPPSTDKPEPQQRQEPEATADPPAAITPMPAIPIQPPARPAPDHPNAAPPAPAPATAAPAAEATTPSAWSWDADRIMAVGAALYLAAAAVVLGRWLFGWAALRRLLGRCEAVSGRPARLFAEMAGLGRRPRLLASRQARAPFSCGLLRPTVVLPVKLCEAPDEALRWVFAHELAHLRRRDAWSGLLFGLAQAVYFPIPWFWPLRRQARLCQEYLADAAAASAGGRPEDYAQFLLAWTAAPRPPVGARGVWGRSSDLFWRVKTMLKSPVPLERRCPRRWSLAAACGLLSLAVLAAGVTLRASAAPAAEPNKEEPKQEKPKAVPPIVEQPGQPQAVPDLPLPDLDDLLKNLPPNIDADQAKAIREQMEQVREQMRRMMEMQRRQGGPAAGLPLNPAFPGGLPLKPAFPGGLSQDGRLGAVVEKPSDTLVEQLDLPKDQGLIVDEVAPDSAAAKAGIKAHDILLELDGKPVPSSPEELRKTLDGIKADTPVDVVVMRKGKKETVKGLSLPEAKAALPGLPGFNPPLLNPVPVPLLPPNLPNLQPNFPNINLQPGVGVGNGVMTTTFRTNDHFTTRHQEGSLIITLTGKVENGKAQVSQISVQDGGESYSIESVDKAPEKYRDKIKNLIEMSEKGSVKVDVKAP